ncbi:MAG: RNA methyltransferase [Lachnospiraceae bacterium]|nr:RNA methyltransferase [Lachnospiraceae bacterium]
MITSVGNNQVRQVIALQSKVKERRAQDLFVVEGPKMFREVPAERLVRVYMSESFYQKYQYDAQISVFIRQCESGELKDAKGGSLLELVSDEVMARMSDTQTPQGVICLVRQYHYRLEDLLQGTPLLMVLENLQDPGNLGTILRTAEGAGVTGIVLSKGSAELYNPKVIRSTMGSIYRMPFIYTEDLQGTIRELQSRGVRMYAAHLKGTMNYTKPDYTGPSAFMIGNESKGLSDATAEMADHYVRIPMKGQVESLNAAVAAAVLMYQAAMSRE